MVSLVLGARSLDQADLVLFLVHPFFVPICFAGSVWEKHLPVQHCFASADLQELYKIKINGRNEADLGQLAGAGD